jgi:hypothetical protein
MLPDLRIVIAAVISTFVLTVGVGFYASTRMMQEPKKRSDLLATLEETPVNRIALSWPDPQPQSEPLALDFAVTARALRNPVRDVTNQTVPAEPQPQPVRTSATDLAAPAPDEKPVQAPSAKIEAAPVPPTIPMPAASETPEPVPEPDIRVAVQYPPIVELPAELQAPPAPVAQMPVAAVTDDTPSTTGSVPEPPKNIDADDADAGRSPDNPVQPVIAVRPDPAAAGTEEEQASEQVPTPKPAPKAKEKTQTKPTASKKAATKKAAPRRTVKRPVRRTLPRVTNAVPNFFNFFTLQR